MMMVLNGIYSIFCTIIYTSSMFYIIFMLLRDIFYWVDFFIATLVMYGLTYLPSKLTNKWYSDLFRVWCKIFIKALKVNLKLHQMNLHPLPKNFLLISNHPSAFEDIGMPALFKVRYLAKHEVKNWWFFGRISMSAGTLYVERESKTSRQEANLTIQEALVDGSNIGLYPEGGCKGRRIHLPFHYGCFDIAMKTNTPILPVFLHYEAQENFEWANNDTLIKKIKDMFLAPNHNANYYVFDAIDPKLFTDKKEFCEHVEQLYLNWQKKYLE